MLLGRLFVQVEGLLDADAVAGEGGCGDSGYVTRPLVSATKADDEKSAPLFLFFLLRTYVRRLCRDGPSLLLDRFRCLPPRPQQCQLQRKRAALSEAEEAEAEADGGALNHIGKARRVRTKSPKLPSKKA